jgi:RNA polymerase sigma factor (sigma-70 family)
MTREQSGEAYANGLRRTENLETLPEPLLVRTTGDQAWVSEVDQQVREVGDDASTKNPPLEFSKAYEAGYPRTERRFIALGATPTEAPDLAQVSWFKGLRAWNTLRESGRLNGWMGAIAINELRSTRRARRCEQLPADYDVAVTPEINPIAIDVHQALQQIGPRNRELLVLKYFRGYTAVEIAQELRISKDAVYAGLARARNAVRELLDPTASAPTGTSRAVCGSSPGLKINRAHAKRSAVTASTSRQGAAGVLKEKTA